MAKSTKPKTKAPSVLQQAAATPAPTQPLRLDLGCGMRKREGFTGVDRRTFPGVDIVTDLAVYPWPFADKSVDEVNCSHLVEHLDHNRHNPERVRFFNELYRIMKPGAKAQITTPHWASSRAYGDFTHADCPVTEFFYYYLDRNWRATEAPDNDVKWNPDGYTCHFPLPVPQGYTVRQDLLARNVEYQTFALQNYKEAAQDLVATITRGEDEVAK